MEESQPIPTEFDSTSSALFNGLRSLGVEQKKIEEDMDFVASVFQEIVRDREGPVPSARDTTEVLDCALIGLTYHRRMPFQMQEPDGSFGGLEIPERADNDYIFTLTAVTKRTPPGG